MPYLADFIRFILPPNQFRRAWSRVGGTRKPASFMSSSLELYIKSYGSGFSQSDKATTPTLPKKMAKLINSKVASDPRIGQDAHGYWECAEIAQLVEQRIRNA